MTRLHRFGIATAVSAAIAILLPWAALRMRMWGGGSIEVLCWMVPLGVAFALFLFVLGGHTTRLVRFGIATAVSAAIAILLPWATFYLRLWAGGRIGLLDWMIPLSIAFALLVGVVASAWPSSWLRRKPAITAIIGITLGLFAWYVAPRLALWRAIGRWPGWTGHLQWDFDLEALAWWTVAGAAALWTATGNLRRTVVASIVLLCVGAMLVPQPVFDRITHNQELTVAFLVPRESSSIQPEPWAVSQLLSTPPINAKELSETILRSVRAAGIAGDYRVSELFRTGHGKAALAIVVINAQITSDTPLRQPDCTQLIYIQRPDGWTRIPSQAATLDRKITMEVPVNEDAIGGYSIEEAGGYGTAAEIVRDTPKQQQRQ